MKIQSCLDIFCKDQLALRKQEKLHSVKVTKEEHRFLEDQMGSRLMLCTTAVDRCKTFKQNMTQGVFFF